MDGLVMTATTGRSTARLDKRLAISLSRKTLFGNKQSDDWHQQIDFTAGILRPSDNRFPWTLVQKHTDAYLKKKGKVPQQEADLRLGLLIEKHDARDVAIAACGHAMSAWSVRALLNVELDVTPFTYYGLETYLESLIAANHCNTNIISDIEAQWAVRMLPYATPGAGAAGRFLEGICTTLRTTYVPNMNALPDFSMLARRAFKDFATQLAGYKLKCQWTMAHSCIMWMTAFSNEPPNTRTPSLTPGQLLDTQFPIWRVWASWRPNVQRLKILDGLGSRRRSVLPDILALEGPDFITGRYATLRDGLIAQYGAAKPLVRLGGLIIEISTSQKEELKDMLDGIITELVYASTASEESFNLFVQLLVARPITREALQLLRAVNTMPPTRGLAGSLLQIWTAKEDINGIHVNVVKSIISALDNPNAESLRKILLRPWLITGISKCIKECQEAVKTHIDTGLIWGELSLELLDLCLVVKASKHVLPLLESSIRLQLNNLPARDSLQMILEVYEATGGVKVVQTTPGENGLRTAIEDYCKDGLVKRGDLSHSSRWTVERVLELWTGTKNVNRRRVAIEASKYAGVDFVLRCRCFSQATKISDEDVTQLLDIFDEAKKNIEEACVKFVTFLAHMEDIEAVYCWKSILYVLLSRVSDTMVGYLLTRFKAWEWFQWMLDLNAIFSEMIMNQKASPPPILRLHTHLWVQQLSEYIPAITRFEEPRGKGTSAVQCLLGGGEPLQSSEMFLLRILDSLSRAQEQPVEKLMQTVTERLSKDGGNASDISECVRGLLATTEEGLEYCQRIMDASQEKETIKKIVMEMLIAGWLQDDDLAYCDATAIRSIAFLLGFEVYEQDVPDEKLIAAAKYYEQQEKELLKEADRLDGIKEALIVRDPSGTRTLLRTLGIVHISPLDEELNALPQDIFDAIEKRGDTEIEISFPLTALTDLQRSALGIGNAKSVLVRLLHDFTDKSPAAFCIHLDNDPNIQDIEVEHNPWVCFQHSAEPKWQYCGEKQTILAWQLSLILSRHLKPLDTISLATLHSFMKWQIEHYAAGCVVCGSNYDSGGQILIRRSAACTRSSCTKAWTSICLELRVPEILHDPFAIDMLLYGVYAAAMSGRTELLPGCPISSTQNVMAVLNTLPALATLKSSHDLSKVLRGCHRDAEQLLNWACTHYGGFITSATGMTRIPGLPVGTHQFVVGNASPTMEARFASRLGTGSTQTRVLFHGTSLDRLPSILAQGLKIHSGTSLQRTGAAHGRGIYMAVEPGTSFSYSPAAVSWGKSGLSNMRLLLGCEVIGGGNPVSGGIHVITDEKCVMVRYIFLFTNTAYAPIANHIAPAMLSAMSALRSGAV